MKQIIHAHASPQIGIGHLVRTLALGEALVARGHEIALMTCVETPMGLVRKWEQIGAEIIRDEGKQEDWYLPERVLLWARKMDADWVTIDGYGFDSYYMKAVKNAGYKLVVLDDLGELPYYHADIIVNPNIYGERVKYACGPGTRLFLGGQYTLLRKEFLSWKEWNRYISDRALKLLLTLGGGDQRELISKILDVIIRLRIDSLHVKVIVAPGNADFGGRSDTWRDSLLRIEFIEWPESIPELMAWADLAICAGGITCLEMAYMGLPNVIIIISDNQRMVAQAFEEKGCSISLGRIEELNTGRLEREIERLVHDATLRGHMSASGRTLVDGQGCRRIVDELMQIGNG